LALADVMGLIASPRRNAVSAFLQTTVDPSDPTYEYHSQGIIETLEKLQQDFRGEKQDLDTEWKKTKSTCDLTKQSLADNIDANTGAMATLSTDVDTLKGEIATARENLVNAEAMLKDDQQYLKELTERCETRAQDWDQRSQMRADEVKALAGALALLKNNVSGLDKAVNERALLVQSNTSGKVHAGNALGSPDAQAKKAVWLASRSTWPVSLSSKRKPPTHPAAKASCAGAGRQPSPPMCGRTRRSRCSARKGSAWGARRCPPWPISWLTTPSPR